MMNSPIINTEIKQMNGQYMQLLTIKFTDDWDTLYWLKYYMTKADDKEKLVNECQPETHLCSQSVCTYLDALCPLETGLQADGEGAWWACLLSPPNWTGVWCHVSAVKTTTTRKKNTTTFGVPRGPTSRFSWCSDLKRLRLVVTNRHKDQQWYTFIL